MKRILLLTDFSEHSINAITYALQLFKDELCTFKLLYSQDLKALIGDDFRSKSNSNTSLNKLNKLVNTFKKTFNTTNFSFETVVSHNELIETVNKIVETDTIDLIVMGSNGVTGASEVLFGSNTINIIRKVDCPTLVIPENFSYRYPYNILLPLDLHDSLSGTTFVRLITFIKNLKETALHILRIKPNNEDCTEATNDAGNIDYFLANMDYKYHTIKNIPMHFVIDGYIQIKSIDFTILLVQKESVLERFFKSSSTTKISKSVQTPLLVFHSN